MKKNLMKKASSLCLAVLLVLACLSAVPFSVSAITATENWDAADDGIYYVSSAADLLAFKAAVAGGNTFAGKTVKLTADISMGGVTWSCDTATFSGTFDGCGHSITNLSASNATMNVAGVLFGSLNGATVQNLSIMEGTYTTSRMCSAPIAGITTGNPCVLQNLYVDYIVNATAGNDSALLVGRTCVNTTIQNCVVDGTIIGSNAGNAGFVGRVQNSALTLKDCAFLGSASSHSEKGFVGAFVGLIDGGVVTATNCANLGSVTVGNGALSTADGNVDTVTAENFAEFYANKYAAWTQTGKTEMMPASVAAMLGKAYDPNAPEAAPEGDVYTIGTPAELVAFKAQVAGGKSFKGDTVKLTADLDMTGVTWTCDSAVFSGTLDGCGHSIQNLNGFATANWHGLLFGVLNGATVKNLKVTGGTFNGRLGSGVIASYTDFNSCTLQNLYVDTKIIGNAQDNAGLLGRTKVETVIQDCVVASAVEGVNVNNWGGFSGFVGRVVMLSDANKVRFIDCVFMGSVTNAHQKGLVGPFIGLLEKGSLEFTNCFSMGAVDAGIGGNRCYDEGVDTVDPATFNFVGFAEKHENWVQTDTNEMMPAGVAQMLGKSYTPEGGVAYVTPGEKIYDYTCMEQPEGLDMATVYLEGDINDASDSWNLEETSALKDQSEIMLKRELPTPRTHVSFKFDVQTKGAYTVAIEYRTTYSDAYQHVMHFAIDDLGREALYLQHSDDFLWVVITKELEAGEHTFTVYAPDDRFEILEGGKMIQSCNIRSVKAYQTIATSSIYMVDGAAVRLTATSGELRYITRVDKALYEMLVATYGKSNISFGTVFGLASDAAKLGELTKEAFNKEAYTYYDDNKTELLEDENGYYFYGYWKAESTDDYDTMMSAAGYVRIKTGGKSQYIYTEYNADNARSVALVAARAAADTKNASEGGYENAVTANSATVYSPYTETEYANLVALAAYNKED